MDGTEEFEMCVGGRRKRDYEMGKLCEDMEMV